MAHRTEAGVRLITRAGNDFAHRFPFIALAIAALPTRSCLIDGEAIVCGENGLAVFDLIRGHGTLASAVHCSFDLLELDDEDLRREPIEARKQALAPLLRGAPSSIALNEHFDGDGSIIYKHACTLGCEGLCLSLSLQKVTKCSQRLKTVADDLSNRQHGHGEDPARNTPHPEDERDDDEDRIEGEPSG